MGAVEDILCVDKEVIVVKDVIWRRLCISMILGVRRGSIPSELIICGGGVRSILLFLVWLDALP